MVLALQTLIRDEECEPNTQITVQHLLVTAGTLPGDILHLSLPDMALLLTLTPMGTFLIEENSAEQKEPA